MRKWTIVIVLLLLLGYLGYNYIYQDHRDIKNEKPEFTLSTQDIAKEFTNNSVTAEKKYLNKTIEVSGQVTEINTSDLTLDNVIFCSFSETINENISINSNLKIKGRLIGYDDLLEQIKIDQVTIIN